ncbi:MAG: PEP-CTERM sorting domain-containing protein, partial [Microcystaceae cyanobacterium]
MTLIILLITTLILLFYDVQPSQATTYKFELHGHDGYAAKVLFSYDEKSAPEAFSEFGKGKTNALESLVVTFFDPLGKPIATYNNVVNGVSNQDFLRFNFDTNTQELFGFFDV